MEPSLDATTALLARTPATLDALLRTLPDAWTRANEGDRTFTPFDIVAHLAHAERSGWMPRVRMILDAGDSRTFEPLDRTDFAAARGKSLGELLDAFAGARAGNLRDLAALNLRADDLDRRGRHPGFGIVTLSQLLATWVAHDMTHLHQLSRVLAHQYREAVGPWTVYLGVMKCDAHSDAA